MLLFPSVWGQSSQNGSLTYATWFTPIVEWLQQEQSSWIHPLGDKVTPLLSIRKWTWHTQASSDSHTGKSIKMKTMHVRTTLLKAIYVVAYVFQHLLITTQKALSRHRFCLPSVEYPSCLQTTLASGTFHRSSHTVPYVLLIQISTLPSVTLVPFTNTTSPSKHAEVHNKEDSI